MHKKFPVVLILLALSFPANSYSQQPPLSRPPSAGRSPARSATPDPNDYSSLPAGQIIDKVQQKIIAWQDDIINGMQAQIFLQNLYGKLEAIAINTDTGDVKDQKLLDLLSKYGIPVTTKDGKKINTPSTTPPVPETTDEKVPFVGNGVVATTDEKRRIGMLLAKGESLIDRANTSKKITASLASLMGELFNLAKTDADVQALLDKYHIKPEAPKRTPAPAPTPTP